MLAANLPITNIAAAIMMIHVQSIQVKGVTLNVSRIQLIGKYMSSSCSPSGSDCIVELCFSVSYWLVVEM